MDDLHEQRIIPFSWENKPGISKVFADMEHDDGDQVTLPPPPCPSDKPVSMFKLHNGEPLHVPLPPCAFDQRCLRSSSKRGFKIDDDPFLIAYKECTKSARSQRKSSSSSSTLKILLGYFSCKASSRHSVRSGTMTRSHRPQPSDNDMN